MLRLLGLSRGPQQNSSMHHTTTTSNFNTINSRMGTTSMNINNRTFRTMPGWNNHTMPHMKALVSTSTLSLRISSNLYRRPSWKDYRSPISVQGNCRKLCSLISITHFLFSTPFDNQSNSMLFDPLSVDSSNSWSGGGGLSSTEDAPEYLYRRPPSAEYSSLSQDEIYEEIQRECAEIEGRSSSDGLSDGNTRHPSTSKQVGNGTYC